MTTPWLTERNGNDLLVFLPIIIILGVIILFIDWIEFNKYK